MPYLNCQGCRLTVYSAVGSSTSDICPRCGASLAEAPRSLFTPVAEEMRKWPRRGRIEQPKREGGGSSSAP